MKKSIRKIRIRSTEAEIELCEFVDGLYTISDKANKMLKILRKGMPTWVSEKIYHKMNVSLWVYNDTRVNAFFYYENENNYIALSLGLLTEFWNEVTDYVNKKNLSSVFELKEESKPLFKDALYFYMLDFTIAHEFGHIVHGHLKALNNRNSIEETFSPISYVGHQDISAKNWDTQLKEYDADSVAVAIQTSIFLNNCSNSNEKNLSNFDMMFLTNYLCFKVFAEKTGRDFKDYMTEDTKMYDHPHPGIRMYYSMMYYSYWLLNFYKDKETVISIIRSGSHAIIAYEKIVLETEQFKNVYFSVGYTLKGANHIMQLHNDWQNKVDYFNKVSYIPIKKMDSLIDMFVSLDEKGNFIYK